MKIGLFKFLLVVVSTFFFCSPCFSQTKTAVLSPSLVPFKNKVTVTKLTDTEIKLRQSLEVPMDLDFLEKDHKDFTYDSSLKNVLVNLQCGPIQINADLIGQDGIDEAYTMVSLLNCNGVNFVSPVKKQRDGTCSTFSHTSILETMIGIRHQNLRKITPDHPVSDFLPIDLAEGFRMYSGFYFINADPVLSGIQSHKWVASPHGAYLPDAEFQWLWGDWNQAIAEALESRYAQVSDYCKDIQEPVLTDAQLDILASDVSNIHKESIWDQRFLPIFNCMFDFAKKKNLVFAGLTDEIHIDAAGGFQGTDPIVKNLLKNGYPVRVSLWWGWDQTKTLSVDMNDQFYEYELLSPQPTANYTQQADGSYFLPNSSGHAIVIVGYLEGNNNNDFWIIKNSHGENITNIRERDVFFLVRTPSTSNLPGQPESTIPNFTFKAPKDTYAYFRGVNFYRLSPQTDSVDKILATRDKDHVALDSDGDGVADLFDNCPENKNPSQSDSDQDFVGDACDICPNAYDSYQDESNPHLAVNDLDRDGIPALCDPQTPDAGLTLLNVGTSVYPSINAQTVVAGNVIPGGWRFDLHQKLLAVGDFDGDGLDDFLTRSSWGIGLLGLSVKAAGNSFRVITAQPFGNFVGSWKINAKDKVVGVGDFNGDGRDDFIVRNNEGLALLTLNSANALVSLFHYRNSQRMGSWRLGKEDEIAGVGDFDDNGTDDFLIKSSWGIGIIQLTSHGFQSLSQLPAGTRLGAWIYRPGDVVLAIGDFNGNGRDDFILQSPWGLGILELDPLNGLKSISMVKDGSLLGKWRFSVNNQLVATGDFDGNGRDDFILQSPWGIGILSRSPDGRINHLGMAKYHDGALASLGEKDEILFADDFDGDGRDEFIIRANWGLSILSLSKTEIKSEANHNFNRWLGNWYFQSRNGFLGTGRFADATRGSLLIKALDY